jgi:hypothetical protein
MRLSEARRAASVTSLQQPQRFDDAVPRFGFTARGAFGYDPDRPSHGTILS